MDRSFTSLASALSISYPPSALFAVAFGVVLVLLVHFSLAVSRLSDQNKVLAQQLGLLRRHVQEQHERLGTWISKLVSRANASKRLTLGAL